MNVNSHIMKVGNQYQSLSLCQKKEFTVIRRPSAILDRVLKSPLPGNGDWDEATERAALAVTQISLFLDVLAAFGNAQALARMILVSSRGEVRTRFAKGPFVLLAPPTRAQPHQRETFFSFCGCCFNGNTFNMHCIRYRAHHIVNVTFFFHLR